MERLTFDGNFCDIAMCRELPCQHGNNCIQKRVWERLKQYEDTGLTPELLNAPFTWATAMNLAAKPALGIEPGRLRELAEADKAGRVVVLPCKVGDTVYVIDKGDYEHDHQPYVRAKTVYEVTCKQTKYGKYLGWGVCLGPGDCGTVARYQLDKMGRSWFLTREKAETALKGEENGRG